ncbi:uncharacterized protein TRIVIDRAFT_194160 [Trichoderma virens Gv29-8]|uniref:Major facilitator superfamily (MFS) profile domain-containing protein n=1 Tax=Hypocrea virens (strain Gv29-8 / FGSC 10586) TaxID=413071 RepID=G9N443_HYPVG|nr:uncharacterized protein TRIVIDRAFT_194160 [Trichoderma virens Gv29-8]EHK18369.1 hypothetical protein TRIVIDRAFT_194160 [Trichoderma virens Gv29-8]UKZ52582.1 hypothetical protein TrVGV298_006360 [Trichoderma virens]
MRQKVAVSRAEESEAKQSIEQRSIAGFRWFLVCFATFSANLLYGLDTTIAADIQGAVSTTMNNVTQLGWLGVGFSLGSTVAILPIGKAYGMFDTKWLFIGSLVNFAAGSALCGAAPTMAALIVGRVWAGVGGAGMYLGTINLMAALTTPTERALLFAAEAFVYGAGCILGPIVGGLLADSAATWRWAFYLNLVVFGAMAPVYLFVIPAVPRQADVSIIDKIKKFDWVGIVLTAGIYVCLVLAFSFGGIIWAWSDGRFIALIVLFVVFTASFAVQQHFALLTNKVDRLFPCEFLGNLEMVIFYIGMAASIAPFFVATYYIPLYFLFIHGNTGTQTAVRLLPLVFVYVASILFAGYALQRVGYRMIWYFVSGLFMVAGGAGMYTVGADTPPSHTYGFSILIGIGLTVSQSGYSLIIPLVEPHRIPDAMQFMNTAQGSAVLLGLVIANPIFQNEAFTGLKSLFAGHGFSDAEIHAAVAGSRSQVLESISPELRKRALDVIVRAIQLDWVLVITGGAIIAVASIFLPKKRF